VKVGNPCRVVIASVNLDRKQIDYQVTELEGAEVETQDFDASRPPSKGRPARGGERGNRPGKSFGGPKTQSRAGAMKAVADRFGGPKSGGRFGDRGAAKSGGRFGADRGAAKSGGRFGAQERGPAKSGGRFGGAPKPGGDRYGSAPAKSGGRFGGGAPARGDRPYRSQDRGGRFGSEPPSARPTQPNPGRGKPPGPERAEVGSTRRFEVEDNRPSRRFDGGRPDRDQRRRESPPPQAWEKKPQAEEPEKPKPAGGGFDVRATLDRLWKERGGNGRKR
jgi:hypothetical protein